MDAEAADEGARQVAGAGGLPIAYETAGPAGAATVLLVHGFASDRRSNWVRTRWVSTLADAGFRVIAADLRGHGESARPHTIAAYSLGAFREDLTAVLDAEAPGESVHLIGYSLGARLAHDYTQTHPERVRSVTMGGPPVDGSFAGFDLAAARAATRTAARTTAGGSRAMNGETARYVGMASSAGNDPDALLRLAEAVRRRAFRPRAGAVAHPLFIVAGEDDPVHDGSRMLAGELPGARFLGLPGRDHVSAVTSRVFRTAAAAFVTDVEEARRSDPSPAGRSPAPGR
ncbi:alpha/beta fold hydrolase [Herbiconiux flava]|uniref:Pimeloyl-ACP methyl ester carboxylesterase n=1 Tax=Herbiconiux flava TaxID=881268 RepID=A0A852SM47_9MICO|nr:alpha/beta hydrolase [Herbiconiux flava]NYD69959.1 pimeloyl-ACP methyl ester carboxylesterase [Herbiconiux flava]